MRDLTVTALSYCVNREVKPFDSSRAAWEYIRNGSPVDMIVCDVDMPQMNGLEFLSKVKGTHPDIIVVMMSGVSEYENRARQAGADAFLAKPFEINDLFGLVKCYVVDPA